MAKQNSFVMYKNWAPLVVHSTDEVAGRLFKAVFNYQTYGIESEDECIAPIFEMMKMVFDQDSEKYRELSRKRSEAAKQMHANASKNMQMHANADFAEQKNSVAGDMKCNDMKCNDMQCDDNDMSCNDISYAEISEEFNSVCVTLPKVKNMNDHRRRSIKARIKEHGRDQVSEVFRKAAESDFLSGRNKEWTNCSFDWLMKPSNFVKVLEGNYDNDRRNVPSALTALTAGDGDDPF